MNKKIVFFLVFTLVGCIEGNRSYWVGKRDREIQSTEDSLKKVDYKYPRFSNSKQTVMGEYSTADIIYHCVNLSPIEYRYYISFSWYYDGTALFEDYTNGIKYVTNWKITTEIDRTSNNLVFKELNSNNPYEAKMKNMYVGAYMNLLYMDFSDNLIQDLYVQNKIQSEYLRFQCKAEEYNIDPNFIEEGGFEHFFENDIIFNTELYLTGKGYNKRIDDRKNFGFNRSKYKFKVLN